MSLRWGSGLLFSALLTDWLCPQNFVEAQLGGSYESTWPGWLVGCTSHIAGNRPLCKPSHTERSHCSKRSFRQSSSSSRTRMYAGYAWRSRPAGSHCPAPASAHGRCTLLALRGGSYTLLAPGRLQRCFDQVPYLRARLQTLTHPSMTARRRAAAFAKASCLTGSRCCGRRTEI